MLQRALNAVLPRDLAVVAAEPVADDFHARYHARAKLYRYRIWNAARPSPLRARHSWWVKPALDAAAMQAAGARCSARTTSPRSRRWGATWSRRERTLTRCDVLRRPAVSEPDARGEIEILVEGSGFLRHMVRILAGTLVQVGAGRREPARSARVIAARDRRAAGPTAPPQGLTLVRVSY